jgi:hypothetical protein
MRLGHAIALSSGNKAIAPNGQGQRIIVQERYNVETRWWHIWMLYNDGSIAEMDSSIGSDEMAAFLVDWNANYWEPIIHAMRY